MKIDMQGLINRLDSLRERINDLLDYLDVLEKFEDVQRYFQDDDTFNLAIAVDVLEQVDKLDRALEIIKNKEVRIDILENYDTFEEYNSFVGLFGDETKLFELTKEEFDLLKEALL